MRYWDGGDLPFTYSLVEHFPIGERFFSSTLAQTYPNRRFLFTGTASGTTATDNTTFSVPAANGTIFDRLDEHQIEWINYFQAVPSAVIVPGFSTGRAARLQRIDAFYADATAGRLPRVTFLDPQYQTTSEENPQDIQVGERFLASIVNALMHAPTWNRRPSSSPTTRAAATTITSRRPKRSSPTASPRFPSRATSAPNMTARLPRPDVRDLAVRQARLRLSRRPGPHFDPGFHAAQVEPAGDDLPRR